MPSPIKLTSPLTPRLRTLAQKVIDEHAVKGAGGQILFGSWLDFEGRRYLPLIEAYCNELQQTDDALTRHPWIEAAVATAVADAIAVERARCVRCVDRAQGLVSSQHERAILYRIGADIAEGTL